MSLLGVLGIVRSSDRIRPWRKPSLSRTFSGRRESNSIYLLPKQAYYRYTTSRHYYFLERVRGIPRRAFVKTLLVLACGSLEQAQSESIARLLLFLQKKSCLASTRSIPLLLPGERLSRRDNLSPGAGKGNRTPPTCLEGRSTTTIRYPHASLITS